MDFHDAYRDLVWAAQSGSLLRSELTARLLNKTELQQLERKEYFEAFRRFMMQREVTRIHKVGLYFELLIEFLIAHVLQAGIIHRNRQVVEHGRTIGEIDYIFDHQSTIWHLETAVKFYLALPEPHSSGSCLVGPNSTDNFESKIHRLFSHQLPLSRRVCSSVTQRVAFVKGRIFYHRNLPDSISVNPQSNGTPLELNAEHEKGLWCYLGECPDVLESMPADRCCLRTKPHWLADARRPINCSTVVPIRQMIKFLDRHFSNNHRPVMLSALIEVDGRFEEIQRIFVVGDTWPE